MTCNQCHGSRPKDIKGGRCTPPVIEIKNPPEATLFHRVDVPASMGDETEYPPEAGLYKNTLLHYEASNNSYLYSSDGIPTKVNGVDGKDGAIQYTAGTGIDISDQNVISATGSIAVAWGDITGDLSNQTDLNNALGAKQDTLTAGANITIDGNNEISATDTTYSNFVGTDGVSAGTAGLVPAPATTDTNAFLKGDGTWGNPPGTTYTAGTNIQINGSTISATDTTYSNFGGATTLVAGSAGLVPAPTTTDPDKFLKGDGTWGTPADTTYSAGTNIQITGTTISATDTTYSNFTGTDGVSAGTAGLVPAPATTDDGKYLKADGTWATVASGGSTITLTNTDPGEGSPLAADNFIGVYGGTPFNDDYATAEIDTGTTWIDGKEIYKKTVDIAPLPNATNKVVAHNISNLDRVIKLEGYGYRSSDQGIFPLPFVSTNAASAIAISIAGANVSIVTGQDRSNVAEAYVTLYYTKTV